MDSTRVVMDFIALLARTTALVREVHIFAEGHPALHDVTTNVLPIDGHSSPPTPSEYERLMMSISLNAELRRPHGPEKQALGIDLGLYHGSAGWLVEASVMWHSTGLGCDTIDSREVVAASIEEMNTLIPPLVHWAGDRFREEARKLPT